MSTPESTCWTVIQAAAAGSPADRETVAHRDLGVVRAYLAARWRGSALRSDLDDAVQEVFVECFRAGGVLEAAGAGRGQISRLIPFAHTRRYQRDAPGAYDCLTPSFDPAPIKHQQICPCFLWR